LASCSLLKATNRLAEAEPLMRRALAIVEVSLEERLEFLVYPQATRQGAITGAVW
jgi:hypothetical protein